MLRLSKKVEYGILALQYLAKNKDDLKTAKEMADDLDISFEFLAKTLQTLKRKGLVNTIQGMKGGYSLVKSPEEISLFEIISSLENHPEIVECVNADTCEREEYCSIKSPMHVIQEKINTIFNEMKLSEFLKQNPKPLELTF